MIRIVIADDHKLVRQSMRYLLDAESDIEVIGEATDGQEAVALARQLEPDLIVMDVSMPNMDGISAAKRIRDLNLPAQVLFLSIFDDRILVQKALQSGARGYILKRTLSSELLPAVYQVREGEIFLSPVLADRWQSDGVEEYSRNPGDH